RRDMITRHMRTHLRPDGSPIPPQTDQLQINIGQLSLNSRSPLLTPEPQSNNLPPQFPTTTTTIPVTQTSILAQQLQIPKLTSQNTISKESADVAIYAAAAAAAQNAALTNYYAREQLNLAQIGRLEAQSQSNFMCRSTPNIPNLLGTSSVDCSTFRSITPTNLTTPTSTNNLAVAAATAFAQKLSPFMTQQQNNVAMIQQLAAAVQAQQQAQLTNNLLTTNGL
uniref:Cubitus interruptus n=1 Tax=Panagrolaimus sp. JU765 TaxID=591449 RepID=A0AC34R1R4_9BILA